jgi:hypothetical protein
MMILQALANFTIMLSADVQLHWFWKTQNLRNTHRWVYCEPTETALKKLNFSIIFIGYKLISVEQIF